MRLRLKMFKTFDSRRPSVAGTPSGLVGPSRRRGKRLEDGASGGREPTIHPLNVISHLAYPEG